MNMTQEVHIGGGRPVQRALILVHGPVSEHVGALLAQRLNGPDQPEPAVAIVKLDEQDGSTEVVSGALRRISQVGVREELSRRGFVLDRLDEIALYVVADLGTSELKSDLARITNQLISLSDRLLGTTLSPLLVLLAPEADDVDALPAMVRAPHPFLRGVVALSPVNEMGLCLPDAEALAETTARLLHALVTTPLRDAPEWLSGRMGLDPAAGMFMSMGIAEWRWDAEAEMARLTAYWLARVFDDWRQAQEDGLTARLDAERLRESLGVEPADLWCKLPGRAPAALPPAFPQPWSLHEQYRPLCQIAPLPPAELVLQLGQASADQIRELAVSLRCQCEQLLDAEPVGGIERLQHLLHSLQQNIEAHLERLDGRRMVEQERVEALKAHHEAQAVALHALLDAWPRPVLQEWMVAGLKPWRWPGLVRRYLEAREAAARLGQIIAEYEQWQWRLSLDDALSEIYEGIMGAGKHLQVQAEEIEEMLASHQGDLERELQAGAGHAWSDASYLARRYARIVEQPAQEAEWAAQIVGGLGRQLAALDDAPLLDLRSAAAERLSRADNSSGEAFGFCDALTMLYPTPEQLLGWWRSLWDDASPLWRYDATEPSTAEATEPSRLDVACSLDAHSLQALALNKHVRWTASAYSGLLLLRLRINQPALNVLGPAGGEEPVVGSSYTDATTGDATNEVDVAKRKTEEVS